MPETFNKDSYSNSSTQGPGTPEIVRKRRNNVNRNNAKWNAIGLPAVNGGAAASGGAATSNGCSRSLLSAVAGPGATRNGHAGEKRGGGGVHGGHNRIGDALVPLAGLEERWPGRKQEISELAGLIGESTDGVPVPPLLVTGPPCTGKTSVVRAVLDHRGCSYAYVNCAEVVQRRDLLEVLVEQVAGGSRDDILAANRVDRTFGDASTENGQPSSSSSSSSSATATATAAPGTAETSREQDLVLDAEARGQQGADQGSRQQQQQQQQQRKGRGRGPRCSSWNVFFRQMAALLARRSQALLNKSPTTPPAAASGCSGGGGGGGGDRAACGSVCGDVGAGGAGGAGNQWRGQDILTKLASLQGMVDSLAGFAESYSREAKQTQNINNRICSWCRTP
ncbi:putative Mn/Fe superoxide dismutase [Ectocarpus siliculosus]|uniref:Mn/Fe superoxide dismutase n=1 Tax=Ectocarpus siliculosus TaxID=2880 RepID=D7FZ80_ECTSI|nr:putative Mn/Fe superoxide dismutase [Ectocarpus siliculosus]|eukprot:CBJ32697.1 putative Mn/Fe superoxide dismutase [Ectocarpus siliculosus]